MALSLQLEMLIPLAAYQRRGARIIGAQRSGRNSWRHERESEIAPAEAASNRSKLRENGIKAAPLSASVARYYLKRSAAAGETNRLAAARPPGRQAYSANK